MINDTLLHLVASGIISTSPLMVSNFRRITLRDCSFAHYFLSVLFNCADSDCFLYRSHFKHNLHTSILLSSNHYENHIFNEYNTFDIHETNVFQDCIFRDIHSNSDCAGILIERSVNLSLNRCQFINLRSYYPRFGATAVYILHGKYIEIKCNKFWNCSSSHGASYGIFSTPSMTFVIHSLDFEYNSEGFVGILSTQSHSSYLGGWTQFTCSHNNLSNVIWNGNAGLFYILTIQSVNQTIRYCVFSDSSTTHLILTHETPIYSIGSCVFNNISTSGWFHGPISNIFESLFIEVTKSQIGYNPFSMYGCIFDRSYDYYGFPSNAFHNCMFSQNPITYNPPTADCNMVIQYEPTMLVFYPKKSLFLHFFQLELVNI